MEIESKAEELKTIAGELGYPIKSELLDKNMPSVLPPNQKKNLDFLIAEIIKKLKPIIKDPDERVSKKDTIRKLYLWMNSNHSLAEGFGEFYEKRFLLVNDDEIALNFEMLLQ